MSLLFAVLWDQQGSPSLVPTPIPLALLLVIPLATRIPSLCGEVGYPQTIAGYFRGADIALKPHASSTTTPAHPTPRKTTVRQSDSCF